MKKITRGTGITEQELTVTETDEEVRDALRALAAQNGQSEFRRVTRIARNTSESIKRDAGKGIGTGDSPQDFANRILIGIAAAEGGIRNGNADVASRFAFEAGVEWATAVMKWRWETDALRGEKVAGGLKNSAHQTNKRHEPIRQARLARMAELVIALPVEKAAAQCEAEGLGSREAIRKQWNRYRPQKRDS